MNTTEFAKRLERLEGRAGGPKGGRLVMIEPGLWPAHVQEAYRASAVLGDQEARDDIIEQQTGERPIALAPGEINLIVVCWDPHYHGPLVTIDHGPDGKPEIVV